MPTGSTRTPSQDDSGSARDDPGAGETVLNPARGPIIQEQALLKALNEGWISGAALDTHYHYPLPQSHPLWQMPNVILTPHISGSSQSQMFSKRVWEIFHENVQRYCSGKPLLNELSPLQLSESR